MNTMKKTIVGHYLGFCSLTEPTKDLTQGFIMDENCNKRYHRLT